MKSIAVYCASSPGDVGYARVAYEVGKALARRGIRLVYGGGKSGLMGNIADGVLENGGEVVGVFPQLLRNPETLYQGLTECVLVDNLQQRKERMIALSDGVIALPGGYGTLDELFDVLARAQLGIFNGPVGILNTNGFYDFLLAHFNKMTEEQFDRNKDRSLVLVDREIDGLLLKMQDFARKEEG